MIWRWLILSSRARIWTQGLQSVSSLFFLQLFALWSGKKHGIQTETLKQIPSCWCTEWFSGLQEISLVTFSDKGLSQRFRSMLIFTSNPLPLDCSVPLDPKDLGRGQAPWSTSPRLSKHWDTISISACLMESIFIKKDKIDLFFTIPYGVPL